MRTPTPLPFAFVLPALLTTSCGASPDTAAATVPAPPSTAAIAAIAATRTARSRHLEL